MTADIGSNIGEAAFGVWNVTSSTAVEYWEIESVQKGVNTTVDLGYKIGEVAVDVWNVTSSAAVDLWEDESV